MSIENNNFGGNAPGGPPAGSGGGASQPHKDSGSGTFSSEFRHNPVSARVPDRVAKGVLSTGILVLDGPNEFVIDFMQALTRPFHVAARVVLSPAVMEQFGNALRENVARFEQRFGPPPTLPKPPSDRRPTLQEIYDEFKLPDDMLNGSYANAVMVGHSASEFFFDFITNFYPTSCVSNRIFMSAAQIPRTLEALSMAIDRFKQKVIAARQAQQQPPPPPPPNPDSPPHQ